MAEQDFLIHTGLTDELPDDHPKAWSSVWCEICGTALHAMNNECMDDWIEPPEHSHAWCLVCFQRIDAGQVVLLDRARRDGLHLWTDGEALAADVERVRAERKAEQAAELAAFRRSLTGE
jgi:hypothetical protein